MSRFISAPSPGDIWWKTPPKEKAVNGNGTSTAQSSKFIVFLRFQADLYEWLEPYSIEPSSTSLQDQLKGVVRQGLYSSLLEL
jgi:hypothetical protein